MYDTTSAHPEASKKKLSRPAKNLFQNRAIVPLADSHTGLRGSQGSRRWPYVQPLEGAFAGSRTSMLHRAPDIVLCVATHSGCRT